MTNADVDYILTNTIDVSAENGDIIPPGADAYDAFYIGFRLGLMRSCLQKHLQEVADRDKC